MILGLDISTSIVGATVLGKEGELLYCESWDLRNKKHYPTLFDKAERIRNKFKELTQIYRYRSQFNIDKVYIEQSLQAFRPGFSSAKTILVLAKFNGIISWLCDDVLGKRPEYINVLTARKLCGIKTQRGENAKKKVLDFFLDNEPSFSIEYTKFGNPVPGSYDRADSLVIARAGYISYNEKIA